MTGKELLNELSSLNEEDLNKEVVIKFDVDEADFTINGIGRIVNMSVDCFKNQLQCDDVLQTTITLCYNICNW